MPEERECGKCLKKIKPHESTIFKGEGLYHLFCLKAIKEAEKKRKEESDKNK